MTNSVFDPTNPFAGSGKRSIVTIVFLIAVVVFYILHYSGGAKIIATLSKISPLIILSMLLVQTIYVALQAKLLQGVYSALGYTRSFSYLFFLFLVMNLVNTIAPLIGVSGFLYLMYVEKSEGIEKSEVMLMGFLYYLLYYLIFLCVLLTGIAYLFVSGEITRPIVLAALIFVSFVFLFFIGGILLFTHPTALLRTVKFIRGILQHLLPKREVLSDQRVEKFVNQSKEAWKRSRGGSTHLFKALFPTIGLHLSSLFLLLLAFKAIMVSITLPVLTTGYAVGTLLNIVSITPGGIGFAEGGMTATFLAFHIPIDQSLIVTLLYRGIFIWFPLLLGIIAIHVLPLITRKKQER